MAELDGVVTGFQYQPDCGFWMRDEPVLDTCGEYWLDITMDADGIFAFPGTGDATFAKLGLAAFNKPIFHGLRGAHRGISTNMVDRIGPAVSPLIQTHVVPRVNWVVVGKLDGLEWERFAAIEKPTEAQLLSWLGIGPDGKHVRSRPGVPDNITYELQEVVR